LKRKLYEQVYKRMEFDKTERKDVPLMQSHSHKSKSRFSLIFSNSGGLSKVRQSAKVEWVFQRYISQSNERSKVPFIKWLSFMPSDDS
jgi:hypothetical protein